MTSPKQLVFLLVIFVILLALPFLASRYVVELAIQVMIFGLFALSLNVLAGHVGAVSFGHSAFFAIGGYTCVFLLMRWELPLWLCMLGAFVLSGVAALVIGALCVRLNQIYFSMLTLAFAMLVWAVILKWDAVTGGDDGFVGVVMPGWLAGPIAFFWFTLAIVATCVGMLWVLSASTMGRVMVAVRENPTRASFLGVSEQRMRLVAFVIAGAFAGIAGSLLALYIRGMFPESAFWTQSGEVVIMVLLGGVHSFIGPLIGAAVLHLLEATIHSYTEYWPIVLGLILLVIVLMAPEGITGLAKSFFARLRR